MSITPKLKCPPDYSILSFRFVECKKVGIVKGISKEVDVDLKDFFIPVTEYSERRFTLKPGQVQRLDAGNLFNYGEQNESYTFIPDDLISVADLTYHELRIFSSINGALLYTCSFQYVQSPTVPDFLTAFTNYYNTDDTLKSYVTFTKGDTAKQSFSLTAKNAGVKQLYHFTFNKNAIGKYEHPGNLTVPYRKWENGRVKIVFVLTKIGDTYTPTNQKNFQWAFDDDYQKLIQPLSWDTMISNTASGSNTIITWQDSFDANGNLLSFDKRPAYKLAVNDLIRTNTTNLSSNIVSIEGYTIKVSEGIGNATANQSIQKIYSPNNITWRTSGELLTLTGGEEVSDTDKLNIETIWIKNNQSFDIQFEIIIAS